MIPLPPPGVVRMNPNTQATNAPPEGHLWVLCWCEKSLVGVPKELIGDTTYSCGRKRCNPCRSTVDRHGSCATNSAVAA